MWPSTAAMPGIRKKFLFQLLYAVSQFVFPLVTYPYISRRLGPEGLGLIGYVEYVAGFIITLAAFGIPFYGVRETARLQSNPAAQRTLLRDLFSIHLFLSVAGCGFFLLFLYLNTNQSAPPLLIALGCLNILVPAFIAEWFFQGNEAFGFITTRGIVLRLAGAAAIFIFVSASKDAVVYYSIIVAIQVAVALANVAKAGAHSYRVRFQNVRGHLKGLWHFFLSSSFISVYVFFDVIILARMADTAEVGYYTVAIKIIKLSLLLVLSLNVILFPRISYLSSNNPGGINELVAKAMQYLLLTTIPLAVGFVSLAGLLVQVLVGQRFVPAVLLVQILAVLPLIIGFSNLFVYHILTPFNQEKSLLRSVLIALVFSLIFHTALAYFFGAKGTAVATLLTETLVTLLTGYQAYKCFRFRFPVATLWHTVLASLPILVLIRLATFLFSQPIAVLIFSVVSSGVVYFLIQAFIFKNKLLRDVTFSLLQKRAVFNE